jgi:PAS domain S-box-containing protein
MISQLQPGEHLCCFYQSEHEHQAIVTAFVCEGFRRGEKCIYIADVHTQNLILDCLWTAGIAVDAYLTSGQLCVMSANDTYLQGGRFQPCAMIDLLKRETEQALAEGYAGLRATGEMTWAQRGLPGCGRLIEYEVQLNAFFPGSRCLALCQYDLRYYEPSLLFEALMTHPVLIINTAVHWNNFYVPPTEVQDYGCSPTVLRYWLEHMAARQRTEEMLRVTQERLQFLLRASPAVIYTCQPSGDYRVTYVSHNIAEQLGYEPSEFIKDARFWVDRIHPDDAPHVNAEMRRLAVRAHHVREYRFRHKDGTYRWIHDEVRVIEDATGQPAKCIGCWWDITAQRQATEALRHAKDELEDRVGKRTRALTTANEALRAEIQERARTEADNARLFEQVQQSRQQLQTLSQRLLETQEAERRHLARELHDEIGQILTGLKLTLEVSTSGESAAMSQRLRVAQALVNDLIRRVRDLSLDLRPAMLDSLGLLPVLLSHFECYTTQTNVQVDFKHIGLEGRRFQPAMETAAFRIVQEALTNVARHAQVNQVIVCIWSGGDVLNVQIEDQGTGFDPGATPTTSSGLAGMRERVVGLGGQLTIVSAQGSGTCIMAELPLSDRGVGGHYEDHNRPG